MLLLISWQLFNSVGAQDDEEVADGQDTNDRNGNDDNSFAVMILQ